MKNKRGTEDISLNIFFGVIAALLIVGAIVLAANKLTIKTGKFECQNINFWDGFNGLKEKLMQSHFYQVLQTLMISRLR